MAETAAERIENLDLDEVKDGGGDSGGTETGSPKDSPGGGPGAAKDTKPGADDKAKGGERPADDGAGDTEPEGSDADEEGYVADELEPDDDLEPEDEPEAPSGITPEMKYIVDNLPTLTVRGKTSEKGQVRTFNIKAAGQLPDSFEFASKREELVFTQQIAAQELKAQQLQQQFQTQQQQRQANQYSEQENADIRGDIAELQREGALPKFKYAPNDRRFESDPAVKAAQEVMDYMNERNSDYAKQGKLYRISFSDAYRQLERKAADNASNQRQNQEDRQRRTVSRQLAGAGSAPTSTTSKARPARSMEDLMARIDMMDF